MKRVTEIPKKTMDGIRFRARQKFAKEQIERDQKEMKKLKNKIKKGCGC